MSSERALYGRGDEQDALVSVCLALLAAFGVRETVAEHEAESLHRVAGMVDHKGTRLYLRARIAKWREGANIV